jgi:hypothetical protein
VTLHGEEVVVDDPHDVGVEVLPSSGVEGIPFVLSSFDARVDCPSFHQSLLKNNSISEKEHKI